MDKNDLNGLEKEITPEGLFLSRRKFLKLSALFGTAYALAACGIKPTGQEGTPLPTPTGLVDVNTPYDVITHYNNYYEFSYDKETVAKAAAGFVTTPWPVEITGLVEKPQVIDAADIIKQFGEEERIYRLRCVEGWSVVVPWNGFSLSKLLDAVKVKPEAKYVRFTTIFAPDKMPGQKNSMFNWPYVEGLRLDEAMHELTILAGGLYGKPLLPQNGAPLRLVVPWKYGYKSIKSIVKIELVTEQPVSLWMAASPTEYGFYSNVNPNITYPRFSQETERRLGEADRRPTLIFNGYGDQVASMYEGMDLKANF